MAKKLQILRGTTAQNDAYTGSIGELTMDTEKVEIRIHDGTTQGGKTIGSGGGASLPILTHVFSDHKLNDISWLNADTFSWQSGDVYVAAYEHLVDDIAVSDDGYITTENGVVFNRDSSKDKDGLIAWTSTDSTTIYTSNPPIIGETPSAWDDNRQVWGAYGSTISSGSNVAYQERISNITITYYKAEDGHKICMADQEANIQSLFDSTGVAWYYVIDTANKQFKLPRTKYAFTGLRDTVGGYVEAGLPNITGEIGRLRLQGNIEPLADGAFTLTGVTTSATSLDTSVTQSGNAFSFDASRSSSVYSNSDTVQPRSTQMYLYFYVGNFEQSALEQTAGITSEQLNNKADVELVNSINSILSAVESKTDTIDTRVSTLESDVRIIGFQLPIAGNAYSFYIKFSNGFVVQGRNTVAPSGVWNLPVPMQDANYVVATSYGTSESSNTPQWKYMGVVKTSTTVTAASNGISQSILVLGMAA